jgi:hypothetical protein
MNRHKIIICPRCGQTVVSQEGAEIIIRNRILKLSKGGMQVICRGSLGSGQACKTTIDIAKNLLMEFMEG